MHSYSSLEREGERNTGRMEKELYEAAIAGDVNSLVNILGRDGLILDKVLVLGSSSVVGSPLHVAASRGHLPFVKHLLAHPNLLDDPSRRSELAEVLDSKQQSPLHLASAKGHLEIVKELTNASRDMCLARDRDGCNPLHLAAMKGHVQVLEELVGTSPHAARARVGRGETILHLCVKYDQLKTLELLLEKIKGEDFVNAKDDEGNTILHLAVADKKFEIIKHVLNNSKIKVDALNESKHTAMDILFLGRSKHTTMDILFLGRSKGTEPDELDRQIEDFLREAHAKRAKNLVQSEWLSEKRAALMVVASLIATMAFQAGVNPPGGVWQDNLNGHRAGEAVMAYNYPDSYPYFLRSNTIGFVASLSTILLLISGLPFKHRGYMWMLVVIMWLTITSMAFTYAFSIVVVTPKKDRPALSRTIVVAVIVWCSVMAVLLLVHTIRLIANLVEEARGRKHATERIVKFGSGKTHGQPQRDTTPSPKSV